MCMTRISWNTRHWIDGIHGTGSRANLVDYTCTKYILTNTVLKSVYKLPGVLLNTDNESRTQLHDDGL